MKKTLILLFLCFSGTVRAQIQPVYSQPLFSYPLNNDLVDWIELLAPTNAMAGMTLTLPSVAGTANYVLTSSGANPDLLSWNSVASLLGNAYIKNQTTLQTSANFHIDGNGAIGGTLNVTGTSGLTAVNISSTLNASGTVTLGNYPTSSGTGERLLATQNTSGLMDNPAGADGQIPIFSSGGSIGAGNFVLATPTAGPGIFVTRGNGTLTISTDRDSTGGDTHYIWNTNSAQTPASFNIAAGAPAKTISFNEAAILNDATTSTANINNAGLSITNNGAWATSGTGIDAGLKLSVTNGNGMWDIYGTSGNWAIAPNGNASFNQITALAHPLSIANGGTGATVAGATGQFNSLNPAGTASLSPAYVMMGMGSTATVTPVKSGTVLIMISGEVNNPGLNDGSILKIAYGTGAAPANGAPSTGTVPGSATGGVITNGGGTTVTGTFPFSTQAVVAGLTIGTTYWIDLQLTATGGGTATLTSVGITTWEQ